MGRAPYAAPAALLGCVAVLASGCGGSGGGGTTTTASASAAELTWAGGVCDAFATWRDAFNTAGKAVRAHPTPATAQQQLKGLQTASRTLVTTLNDLGKPKSSAADEAAKTLQTLRGQLANDLVVLQRQLQQLTPSSTRNAATAPIAQTISTMTQQLHAAGDAMRGIEGGLGTAFSTAPSCQALQKGPSLSF